jgi:hypothetical protein
VLNDLAEAMKALDGKNLPAGSRRHLPASNAGNAQAGNALAGWIAETFAGE